MDISITQASQTYGINRSTLYRYMENGTLSYTTLANGKRSLNPGEIERVFEQRPKTSKSDEVNQSGTPSNVLVLETKVEMLQETVSRLERDKAKLEEDKMDLRNRLDGAEKERRTTLHLLEYHQQVKVPWWKSFFKITATASA